MKTLIWNVAWEDGTCASTPGNQRWSRVAKSQVANVLAHYAERIANGYYRCLR